MKSNESRGDTLLTREARSVGLSTANPRSTPPSRASFGVRAATALTAPRPRPPTSMPTRRPGPAEPVSKRLRSSFSKPPATPEESKSLLPHTNLTPLQLSPSAAETWTTINRLAAQLYGIEEDEFENLRSLAPDMWLQAHRVAQRQLSEEQAAAAGSRGSGAAAAAEAPGRAEARNVVPHEVVVSCMRFFDDVSAAVAAPSGMDVNKLVDRVSAMDDKTIEAAYTHIRTVAEKYLPRAEAGSLPAPAITS